MFCSDKDSALYNVYSLFEEFEFGAFEPLLCFPLFEENVLLEAKFQYCFFNQEKKPRILIMILIY
jgi:hypothetical protein